MDRADSKQEGDKVDAGRLLGPEWHIPVESRDEQTDRGGEFICAYLQLRTDVGSAAFVDPRPRFLLSSRVRVHKLEARYRLR